MKKFQPEDESAAAGQTGDRRSDEDCGAEDCGERAVVGFNADYLFDAVGTPTRTHTFTADCPGDVTLYFTDPLSPAVVSDRFDRATVVMPIRI
jgi:DNA polymerase III sliding clamp (beta) subunit (PCNA family)